MFLSPLPALSSTLTLIRSLPNESTHTDVALWTFFLLHLIGGHFALPLLLLLSWARESVGRNIVFHNFIITWILYSISFCLLLYANQHVGPAPSRVLCVTQSSLVYAVPVLVATSLWTLVFQLWLDIHDPQPTRGENAPVTTRMVLLVLAPYVASIGFLVFPTLVGVRNPKVVSRVFFYCATSLEALTTASAVAVLVFLVVIIVLEVLIARELLQCRNITKDAVNRRFTQMHFLARVVFFTTYIVLSMVACAIAVIAPKNTIRVIIQATGPLFAFIAFGTSPDLYRTRRRLHDYATVVVAQIDSTSIC